MRNKRPFQSGSIDISIYTDEKSNQKLRQGYAYGQCPAWKRQTATQPYMYREFLPEHTHSESSTLKTDFMPHPILWVDLR